MKCALYFRKAEMQLNTICGFWHFLSVGIQEVYVPAEII